MMLDNALKEQVKSLFSSLKDRYVFKISARTGHPSRTELIELLEETASCSENITCHIEEGADLEFGLLKNQTDTGICFRGIPSGHEFSSLLLAVLNADGVGKNLPDENTRARIKALKGPVELTTYMSLSCTNCPDVVQSLNVITLLHPSVRLTIIDGALHQEKTERLHIQAVPTVYVGQEILHVGRSNLNELLEKLEERLGSNETEVTPQEHHFDVLVAGGGPAGAAAAIYSARKGLKVGVVAKLIGGQVNETVGIENLISVPYTTGTVLAGDLRKHMEAYNIALFENRQITGFEVQGTDRILLTKHGESFHAPALIIATGASWRKLNVEGETEYTGRGVAFCPHCDGPFYKGKDVAVIGGGNSGVEAAIDLAGICRKVMVLEFMDSLKADTVLQEKLKSLPNVTVRTSVQTLAVTGDGTKMNGLKIRERNSGAESTLTADGVFIQIGLKANSNIFGEKLECTRNGEIISDKQCRTSLSGVYAAGDVSDVAYKQIIIAMGEGAKAALSAFEDRIKGC